jgi:hypothetical protein
MIKLTSEEMDKFTTEAHNELLNNIHDWAIRDLINWWHKWYMKTGHKRLGRILVQIKKEKAND